MTSGWKYQQNLAKDLPHTLAIVLNVLPLGIQRDAMIGAGNITSYGLMGLAF
jgi:hypothetical protein